MSIQFQVDSRITQRMARDVYVENFAHATDKLWVTSKPVKSRPLGEIPDELDNEKRLAELLAHAD